jgi:3-oxoacyl-[acyl-carrier protein] reductase
MSPHTQYPDLPELPRTAVVTGAGRGIGRGVALGLAEHGYEVALVGRTPENLEAVAEEIDVRWQERCDSGALAGARPQTAVVPAELTDPGAVRSAVERIEAVCAPRGGVGLLVNNAGVIEEREVPFAEDDVEDTWRVIETNLRGPLEMTHSLLPGMLARGGGRIINMNSGFGHRPMPTHTGYAISKGALARMTTALNAQYRDQGLRIFDIAPGVVQTDMTAAMPSLKGWTQWTPLDAVLALVLAVAGGGLDRLSGRFLRAEEDLPAELVARTYEILVADARTLRLVPYGQTDPMVP